MTFISHAINFEDVLLWRALGHVKNGFYIDVGANDPVEHSVTKAFYDKGWSGINIEPLPKFRTPLLEQRPRDINLTVAAGAVEGEVVLFDIPAVNGWATSDPEVARTHKTEGFELVEIKVPMCTLASVCQKHVAGEIHFLKVDVEGFEAEVLRGMDFFRWRPWVVMVEATLPNSRVLNHESWEALVVDFEYKFAYFDGVNRYYVAIEHEELLPALSVQVNVFDHFVTSRLMNALESAEATWKREKQADANTTQERLLAALSTERAEMAEARVQELEKLVEDQTAQSHRQSVWALDLEQRVVTMQQSFSWRLTHPLRLLGHWIVTTQRKPRVWVYKIFSWLTSSTFWRQFLLPQIQRFPVIEKSLMGVARRINVAATVQCSTQSAPRKSVELENLPLSAQIIFSDLTRVCGVKQTL